MSALAMAVATHRVLVFFQGGLVESGRGTEQECIALQAEAHRHGDDARILPIEPSRPVATYATMPDQLPAGTHERAAAARRLAVTCSKARAEEILSCVLGPSDDSTTLAGVLAEALDRAGIFPSEATLAEIDEVAREILDGSPVDMQALRLATACRKAGMVKS